MGEAKRKRAAGDAEFTRIDAQFKDMGVDTSSLGFYDQQAFLDQEAKNPKLLEAYGRWVALRPRSDAYEKHAKAVVPKVAQLIGNAFSEDGFQGSCIAGAGMISRILDRLGVWNYGIMGSATFEVGSPRIWRGLATVDHRDFPNAVLGHAWVSAPPYVVVDATVLLQRWGDDPIVKYLPPVLVSENPRRTSPSVDDVVSASKREEYFRAEGRADGQLHFRLEPNLVRFGTLFPASEIQAVNLKARYVPTAISMTDVPLEQINVEGKVGRSGAAIWKDVIAPAFDVKTDQ